MLLVLSGAFVNVLANALSPRAASVSVAAVGAFVVIAVHSLLDFSIQIEAVAILFAILVGAGTGVSLGTRAAAASPAAAPDLRLVHAARDRAPQAARARLGYTVVKEAPPPPAEPEEAPRRIYVFGDLHGRSDLAAGLKAAITRDMTERPCDRPVIVGLGDYIDRGPDLRGVLELLSGAPSRGGARFHPRQPRAARHRHPGRRRGGLRRVGQVRRPRMSQVLRGRYPRGIARQRRFRGDAEGIRTDSTKRAFRLSPGHAAQAP